MFLRINDPSTSVEVAAAAEFVRHRDGDRSGNKMMVRLILEAAHGGRIYKDKPKRRKGAK